MLGITQRRAEWFIHHVDQSIKVRLRQHDHCDPVSVAPALSAPLLRCPPASFRHFSPCGRSSEPGPHRCRRFVSRFGRSWKSGRQRPWRLITTAPASITNTDSRANGAALNMLTTTLFPPSVVLIDISSYFNRMGLKPTVEWSPRSGPWGDRTSFDPASELLID